MNNILEIECPACIARDINNVGWLTVIMQDHDEMNAEFCIELKCDQCGKHWTVFANMQEKEETDAR